jgi:hypothetical protein
MIRTQQAPKSAPCARIQQNQQLIIIIFGHDDDHDEDVVGYSSVIKQNSYMYSYIVMYLSLCCVLSQD